MMTEWLFAYGTLQLEPVQVELFGRRLDGIADTLAGFSLVPLDIEDSAVVALSGKSTHTMASFTGCDRDIIAGTAFRMSPAEIEAADGYEVPAVVRVQVTLQSGAIAWVYVDRTHAPIPQ